MAERAFSFFVTMVRGIGPSSHQCLAAAWFCRAVFLYGAGLFRAVLPAPESDHSRDLFSGFQSLLIILVSGLFIGMVLGMQGSMKPCSVMDPRKRLGCSWRCR